MENNTEAGVYHLQYRWRTILSFRQILPVCQLNQKRKVMRVSMRVERERARAEERKNE